MFKLITATAIVASLTFSSLAAVAAEIETRPAQNAVNADYVAGKRAADKKDWAAASNAFRKAVANEPSNADAYTMLGYSLRWEGKLDEAFAAYDRALKLDPNHRGAHQYLGVAYIKAGKMPQAEAQLVKLEQLGGKNAEEYQALAKALVDAKK